MILVALGVLLLGLWFILWKRKRRFFDRNGGQILKNMNINIFTKAQLNKITNKYNTTIGIGFFGKVYLGTTDDNQQVAVKVSKTEARVNDDFVNEIIIQCQISHVNLVRLLGCCLETNVPRLVFEFVANGSLYDVLHVDHGTAERRTLSLSERLDIAIGSAEALAYMHSQHASRKILHGDVKSGNILLDDNFQPKVSDFGLSKLLSSREKKYTGLVTGDECYIDPVYMKTGLLTEKSDVYSFGVVLLELITGKEARYNGNNSLPIEFKKSYKTSRAREMLDENFTSAADIDYLEKIGTIAVQCLEEYVDDRPTMALVLDDLKKVKARAGTE